MLSLAVLSTNRLPDGSEHYGFHGLMDVLRSWGVDLLRKRELQMEPVCLRANHTLLIGPKAPGVAKLVFWCMPVHPHGP